MKRIVTLLAALALFCCGQAFAQEYVATPVTVSKEKVKLNGKVYLSHVVLEKQTVYGITKAYGISEDELYEANPTLRETGLQKNAIILIPYKENAGAQKADENAAAPQSQEFIEHTVRWYEDIDDIARRYDVTVKDILEANGLKSRKLQTRQVLKIPVKGAETPVAPVAETPQETETEETQTETITVTPIVDDTPVQEVTDSTLLVLRSRDRVDFSLVLPLRAGSGGSEINMDFYSGVLMALKDLEAEGLKVHMNVYDLNAGLPPIDVLTKGDFVLGPMATRDLTAILQRVNGQVPVISPLDQKAASLSTEYRNFIQAPSAAEHQYEDLAQWVKEDSQETDKIILVTEKGAGNVTAPVAIRSALARREMTYDILNYAIVEGRGIPASLMEMMVKGSVNRVIVASESEAFVGDVIRNLGIMLGRGYDIVMYAPSKVRTFDTIEGSAYHDAFLHISSPYFVDYSDPKVAQFVQAYRALFQTEPSQFAFQGYDTARYFILRCARYGNHWTRFLSQERSSGLHTDFLFLQDESGNSHNRAVRRIVFNKDYTTNLYGNR